MNQKTYFMVVGVIFSVLAIFHALRLVMGWGAVIYTFEIPLWWSFVGLLVAGFLAWTGLKFART